MHKKLIFLKNEMHAYLLFQEKFIFVLVNTVSMIYKYLGKKF